jgi:phage baseplate assembly protein W
MQIAFPFEINQRGQIARATELDHIREMVEQVLFTNPGERMNRPDFGCGLSMFLFRSPTDEVVTALEGMLQGALQRWLGDLIRVETVSVAMDDAALTIALRYTVLSTQQRVSATLRRGTS